MTLTVDVAGDSNVRLTDEVVAALPSGTIEFAVEGTLSVAPDRLAAFEGRRLRPVAVGLSVADDVVTVDLSGDAALRLDAIDVGVETPDRADLPSATDPDALADGVAGAADRDAGVVAFTVEGTVAGVDPATVETLEGESPGVASVTFTVDEVPATDGGSGDDVLAEVALLGFGVVIRRDGTITIAAA